MKRIETPGPTARRFALWHTILTNVIASSEALGAWCILRSFTRSRHARDKVGFVSNSDIKTFPWKSIWNEINMESLREKWRRLELTIKTGMREQ
jgi:hypothetical protein